MIINNNINNNNNDNDNNNNLQVGNRKDLKISSSNFTFEQLYRLYEPCWMLGTIFECMYIDTLPRNIKDTVKNIIMPLAFSFTTSKVDHCNSLRYVVTSIC